MHVLLKQIHTSVDIGTGNKLACIRRFDCTEPALWMTVIPKMCQEHFSSLVFSNATANVFKKLANNSIFLGRGEFLRSVHLCQLENTFQNVMSWPAKGCRI